MLTIGRKLAASEAVELRDRLVGHWRRATIGGSAASSTEDPVLRLDDVPVLDGLTYRITLYCHPNSTVGTDTVQVTIRYTTDGNTPTITDAVLPGAQAFKIPTGGTTGPLEMLTTYTPAADETLSLIVTVARSAGTGTCELYADGTRVTELLVELCGTAPASTGADL